MRILETENLAQKIVEELRERQQEMSNCSHPTIGLRTWDDGDKWVCDTCEMEFQPKVLGGNYELEDLEVNITVKEKNEKSLE